MKIGSRGFTVVELLVTLALVGIAASIVLPMASILETRAKEAELKASLRQIRTALDAYKVAADAGVIDKPTGSSGYPSSLAVLAAGVPRSAAMGFSQTPMVFLRRIPKDPFAEDKRVAPEKMWRVRPYGAKESAFGDSGSAADVFDVSTKSERVALDGTLYREW